MGKSVVVGPASKWKDVRPGTSRLKATVVTYAVVLGVVILCDLTFDLRGAFESSSTWMLIIIMSGIILMLPAMRMALNDVSKNHNLKLDKELGDIQSAVKKEFGATISKWEAALLSGKTSCVVFRSEFDKSLQHFHVAIQNDALVIEESD